MDQQQQTSPENPNAAHRWRKKFPLITFFFGLCVGAAGFFVGLSSLRVSHDSVKPPEQRTEIPSPVPTMPEAYETSLISRDGDLLHTLYFSDEYKIDIETTDLKTHQVVTKHADDPYYHLVLKNAAFAPMTNAFFKTQGDYRYFVFSVHHYGSAYEVYVASENLVGSSSDLQSFMVLPLTVKGSAYFGIKIIDYYPEINSLLVVQGFGDGCGGNYELNVIKKGGSAKTIKEYGSGCADRSRFLGYFKGKAYFADLLHDNPPGDWDWNNAAIASVYALDPITGNTIPLKSMFTDAGNRFDTAYAEGKVLELLGPNEALLYNSLDQSYYAFDVMTDHSRKLEIPDGGY